MSSPELTVVIASFLESELATRIADHRPERVQVIYEPQLLPWPRYESDHRGVARELSPAQLDQWRSYLASADVLFDFDWLEPANLPTNAPRLRWVQATSSGIGEFLGRHRLLDVGIVFTTAAGVHAVPLAEFVVLGLLHFVKGVPQLRSCQAARHWERHTTRQLSGQRALVVGLGHVGSEIARVLCRLGVEVWAMTRSAHLEPAGVARMIVRDEFSATLPAVDAVVLACPHTAETHHLIGAAELAAMRTSAILVNVARGPVVDEAALVTALRSGQLAGACLDVFEREPLPTNSALWDMPNVLISPHSASTVAEENARIVDLFLDNLDRFLAQRPLRNRFDRDRAY